MKPKNSYAGREITRLVWLAILVSVFAFLSFYRRGDVLLYGDAVAHINIARRVFDSKTPGLLQLGTVWLPLPHLLILPFVVSSALWQGGGGGSIPSMMAYVLGVAGMFRLMRGAFLGLGRSNRAVQMAAWCSAIVYGANPNLLYMQATAMGESLYLAFFIWTVVHFSEFARADDPTRASSSLTKCSCCLAAACLTRYDGWFLAGVMVIAVAVVAGGHPCTERKSGEPEAQDRTVRRAVLKFLLIAAAAPVLWLAYNAIVYRNPLEFANGPYSAKAIEQTTGTVNPTENNLYAAGSYFLKAAELNVGPVSWQGRSWLVLAVVASLVAWFRRQGRAAFLLWAPLPFYALSVAYGSVPIFVPAWWPFTHYNVRYGLQLLPVFAAGSGALIALAFVNDARNKALRRALALVAAIIVIAGYVSIWRAEPICLREAEANSRGRVALEKQVAGWLTKLPPDSTLLMYLGEHVGAVEQAGIPLRHVVNEGNHRVWKQPSDPDGLWERALADPAAYADFVVAFEGDRVWNAVEGRHLTELVEIHTAGQPRAVIYEARTR